MYMYMYEYMYIYIYIERERERVCVLFIGTQFSILYTSMYSQHPACPLDGCVWRNRQVRTSTRTLHAATREVAQRAQRHARVLRSGHR